MEWITSPPVRIGSFRHPEAAYFAADLVTRDQVEDYARRKKTPRAEAERWLAPNLAYEAE